MLEKLFDASAGLARVRALRSGPNGSLLENFAGELLHSRYANVTARRHIRSAEHFVHVATRKSIPMQRWDEQALKRFGQHLLQRRCGYGHAVPAHQITGARLFLKHLRAQRMISGPLCEPVVKPPLLVAFRLWMSEQRGSCAATLDNYDGSIGELLKQLGGDPQRLDAHHLRQFFLEYSKHKGHALIKHGATALRMFVRFLIATGQRAAGLEAAIPLLAYWRLSSLPRYFQAEEVERIVAACDPTTSVGKRDRAILLLLARLGLRAGDVVQLRLGDIDWQASWIHVCGKGSRPTRLPLTQEVGDALVAYLKEGRPQTDADRVFVCCRAPFHPFASHCAVSVMVACAIRRAGITPPSRGAAHLLRHSVATSLLRQGASLSDIATVLRHRSIQTTQIYAKVDVTALRQIAQPWPEVRSC